MFKLYATKVHVMAQNIGCGGGFRSPIYWRPRRGSTRSCSIYPNGFQNIYASLSTPEKISYSEIRWLFFRSAIGKRRVKDKESYTQISLLITSHTAEIRLGFPNQGPMTGDEFLSAPPVSHEADNRIRMGLTRPTRRRIDVIWYLKSRNRFRNRRY